MAPAGIATAHDAIAPGIPTLLLPAVSGQWPPPPGWGAGGPRVVYLPLVMRYYLPKMAVTCA